MKVLFWGTPEFGIPSLDALRAAGHEIVGVVTNPDRPAGRGRALRASPVKEWALSAGVPVLQPERPSGEEFMTRMEALGPELSVVAAYGQILREDVLELPPRGSLNVHASFLPGLRGAAPINWAIIRGHPMGGVTIMRMVLALDAGPILTQEAIPIGETMTAGDLYRAAAERGGALLVGTLVELEAGTLVERPQDEALATYAPKLTRGAARIDWTSGAEDIGRWIRGCDPWPAAWTMWGDTPVQCFSPRLEPVSEEVGETPDRASGQVLEADGKRGLLVQTGSGALRIGEVKPAGRRRMTAADWIRGTRGLTGERLH